MCACAHSNVETCLLQGAVLVTLKSATNIPAADPNGLSDPYVVFTLQKETKQSAVQLRTLTPAWEEKHDWTRVRAAGL